MSITAENLNLDSLTLHNGEEIENPPVIVADDDTVDREATAEAHNGIVAWSKVAHRIASGAEGTQPRVVGDDSKELRKAYSDLPVRGKAWARTYADDKMRDALSNAESNEGFIQAVIWREIGEDMKGGVEKAKAERKPKVQVSPTEQAATKLATLRLATDWFIQNQSDDVEDEFEDQAEAKVEELFEELESYMEWLNEEPAEGEEKEPFEGELSPEVSEAAKLIARKGARKASAGGSRSAFTGVRRNVAAHIENAFAGVESGKFLTVAEIVGTPSPEYGDDKPSSGAVSARLFPRGGGACTIPGIEPGKDSNGKLGAAKS